MNRSPWEPTPPRKGRYQRRGTTLVEVMAAGAMSVLLLGSLTMAMRAMQKQESAILNIDHGFEPWKQQLRSTIEWDVANSRTWNHRFTSLRMIGFTGRDSSGRASLSKNMVEYRLVQIDGATWLVRDSTSLDQPDAKAERTLLCRGISKILIGRPEDDLRSLLAPRGEFDTFFPIPARLRCVLVDANDEPVLDFLILQSGGGA
jgi:hypothetical protein